jgi:hypothetical protein
MSGNEELKKIILDWFEGHSREGTKTKFYLKDVVKALPEHAKSDVQKAVFECIDEGTLMWFSTGSTSMIVLSRFHKG